MAGVMGSSIGSGFFVARTGRYKWMTVAAMALGALGLYLMTNIRADTDVATVWLWMFIAGVGIGPSFAVFTIVVQSAVAPRMLGAATSALTFFRQVGGSVGLAIAGTIFGSSFADELPRQMSANGLPQPLIDGFARGGAASLQSNLTGVGVNLGDQILASVPEQFRPTVEPFIGGIVDSIYQAFSLAVANSMWLALFGALGAAVVVALFVPELTLRHTTGPGAERAEGAEGSRPIIPAME
jgi:MFS family permease